MAKAKTFHGIGGKMFKCNACGFESTRVGVRSHVGSIKCKKNQELYERAKKLKQLPMQE